MNHLKLTSNNGLAAMAFSILTLLLGTGCGKANTTGSDTAAAASQAAPSELEVTMTSISSLADDTNSSSGGVKIAVSQTTAAVPVSPSLCGYVAAQASCQADQPLTGEGLKQAVYSGCTIPYTGITANGQVSLTYSNNLCSLATAGDSVARTYGMTYTDYWGVQWEADINSSNTPDYNGNVYSGGGELDKTTNGWNAIIHGRHESLTGPAGKILADISLRTTSPLQITGTLSRENRVVNSGAIEVNHNLAKYTVTYTPVNLTWNSTQCCHPVSGSLNVTYAGSKTGTGTVVFNGCGSAALTGPDGNTTNVTLNNCE